jgi:hypothetical protein
MINKETQEPVGNMVDAIAKLNEALGQKCMHFKAFPIRNKYLHFRCLGCKKELEIKDVRSLKLLSDTFFEAGSLLASRGIVLG